MNKYTVIIEETIVENFVIEANSFEEAIKNSIEKYKSSEFALESGECIYAQITALTEDQEILGAKWIEI